MTNELDKNVLLVAIVGIFAIVVLAFSFTPTGYVVSEDDDLSAAAQALYRDRKEQGYDSTLYESIKARETRQRKDLGEYQGLTQFTGDPQLQCEEKNAGLPNADVFCTCRLAGVTDCKRYTEGTWNRAEYDDCMATNAAKFENSEFTKEKETYFGECIRLLQPA